MTVQVEHGAYRGEVVPVKTRASRRRVDLSSTAARVLRRQLLAGKPNERGLVFASPRGEILNDGNFRHRVFRPAVRRSGLSKPRVHRNAATQSRKPGRASDLPRRDGARAETRFGTPSPQMPRRSRGVIHTRRDT
jgi:hypothetical protein